MTRKAQPQKRVLETYRDPNYAGPGLETSPGEWVEDIGPFTTDRNTLMIAGGAVEAYTAAWLIYFTTGELVGLWKPPTIIEAVGLDYATDRRKARLWQVEGIALVEAAKLTDTMADLAHVMTTDYRVEGARVMRQSSAACQRAAAWCAQYERAQKVSGVYDRPPSIPLPGRAGQVEDVAVGVVGLPEDDDAGRLEFYRSAMFGESVGQ